MVIAICSSLSVDTVSSSVDLSVSRSATNRLIESDIVPVDLAESIEALSPSNSHSFDGTYNSTVQNSPWLDGTMVISGTNISYSCALGALSAHDVHMSNNTIAFKLTSDGVTFTFAGVYVSKATARSYLKGIVHLENDVRRSGRVNKGLRKAASSSAVDEDTWTAEVG